MSSFSYRDERFAIKLAELIFFYGSKHKSFLVRVGGTMKGAFALMMIGEMCLLADGLLGLSDDDNVSANEQKPLRLKCTFAEFAFNFKITIFKKYYLLPFSI